MLATDYFIDHGREQLFSFKDKFDFSFYDFNPIAVSDDDECVKDKSLSSSLGQSSTSNHKYKDDPDQSDEVPSNYISSQPLSRSFNYFEIEVNSKGPSNSISIGLCNLSFQLDEYLGWSNSIAYFTSSGHVYNSQSVGLKLSSSFSHVEKVGCGIKFDGITNGNDGYLDIPVFFTVDGAEVGQSSFQTTSDLFRMGLYPAVSLNTNTEYIKLNSNLCWPAQEVDATESEEWGRLKGIRQIGEDTFLCVGQKSCIGVGVAQACHPLGPECHYFEVEILQSNPHYCISIGLTDKNYILTNHLGCERNSVGYHTDDGKLFLGQGYGSDLGPVSRVGDWIGCGLLYTDETLDILQGTGDDCSTYSVSGETELEIFENMTMQLFFTWNGELLGKKRITVPIGGYYPTIAMMNEDDLVRVDLHPLSG